MAIRYIGQLTLLGLCLTLFACSGKKTEDHDDHAGHNDAETTTTAISNRIDVPESVRRNLGITFAKVEMRRIASTLRMPGRFELLPSARREYHAPLPGRVEVLVRQYDEVSTGQALYELDSPEWRKLQQEIADAEAQVRSTSASLVHAQIVLQSGGKATEVASRRIDAGLRHVESLRQSLTAAENRLTQTERVQQSVGGRIDEVSEAKAKVAEARTALTLAEEEAADLQREVLRQSGETGTAFSSTSSLVATYEARSAEHSAALMRHRVARASAASVLDVTDADLDKPVANAAGEMEPLWRSVNRIEIKASAPGVVQSLNTSNGAYIDATQLVLAVSDPTQVRFRAVGLQSDLDRLHDGLKASVISPTDQYGISEEPETTHELPGTLVIGQEANADQRSLDIIIIPEVAASWARPGVAAYAEVVLDDSEEPVTAIPVDSVIQDDLQKIYFRRDPENPDKVIRLTADLGISDGIWVAAESGVATGDEVVVGGVYQLKLTGGGKASEAGHFHADGTFHVGEH